MGSRLLGGQANQATASSLKKLDSSCRQSQRYFSRTRLSDPHSRERSFVSLTLVQALLRREIPDGDPGAIFDRAIALLLEKVEKAKLGAASKPRTPPAIRPGTDNQVSSGRLGSRHTARHIKRSAWAHDGGQCEFHHIRPHARGGPTSVENISLRCRRHHQYDAEPVFGPRPRRKEGDS